MMGILNGKKIRTQAKTLRHNACESRSRNKTKNLPKRKPLDFKEHLLLDKHKRFTRQNL